MATGKITKRRIDAMEAGDELWDSELKGFGVRCRSGNIRSYMLMYRAGKRQRRYTIGRHGVLTTDQARTEAKRLLGLVASGGDPLRDRQARTRVSTLGDIIDVFVTLHVEAKLKPATAREYRRMLRTRIKPALGKHPIQKITRSDVTKLHHDLSATPREANHTLAVLSKLFSWAEKHDYRPDGTSPCRHVERFKENKKERYLSAEEIARLHKALTEAEMDGSLMPSSIQCLWLLHLTGCRRSEALGLMWAEVDFETRCIKLSPERNKTNREKEIHLSASAIGLLKQIPRVVGNPYVFVGRKAGLPLVKLDEAWRTIREKAGLADVRIHDLRHTYASLAVGAGMSLPKIGKLLGHLTPSTTQRYAHLNRDALRDDVEKIGELLSKR